MSKSLTRQELYNLVWKKPAMQIAKEYGLSDRGLGKLCERNGIPTPPRGYWAKIAAGQKIKKPPLLLFNTNDDAPVLTKIEKVLSNNNVKSDNVLSAEMKEIVDYEKDPANKIVVPKRSTEYHKVIKRYEIERQRWDKTGLSSLDRRIFRILTAFLNALELRGYNIIYEDNIWRTKVQNGYEHVYIGISEYVKRTRKETTEEDRKDYLYRDSKYKFVEEKTGKLKFSIYTSSGHMHKSFIETDETPLEEMLNKIIIDVTEEILKSRSWRLNREESEHRYYLEQEKIRKEKERRANLLEEVNKKNTADSIRKYVEDCSTAYASGKLKKEGFENWKQWALDYADEIDPLIS